MKINPPITKEPSQRSESNSRAVISDVGGSANHELPYKWNKETNSYEFIDGKSFMCPTLPSMKRDD